jgi:hypothetical protein
VALDSLEIQWSPIYHPQWADDPERYLSSGLLTWGRSRRLGRFEDRLHAFKAYLGVYHSDPGIWGDAGLPRTRYFLSLFLPGQSAKLQSYDTTREALAALDAVHRRLLLPD